MNMKNVVREALKGKNPALHKELTASGKLNEFVPELAC